MISNAVYTATPGNADHVVLYETITQTSATSSITLRTDVPVVSIVPSPEDSYDQKKAIFYKSYDPSVGYNTAAVLGGLLIAVLLYVFYRTKIRKPLIRFCKRKFKEFMSKRELKVKESTNVNEDNMPDADQADKPFLPVVEENLNCDEVGAVGELSQSVSKDKPPEKERLKYQLSVEDYSNIQKITITDDDHQPLPIVFMDVDHATADWVHKQHQYLEPGGIILKVKSDTICPPNNEIQPSLFKSDVSRKMCCMNPNCRLNTGNSHFGARSQNALNLNKSMPMFDIQDIATVQLQNEMPKRKRCKKVQLKAAKIPSISSEPKTPTLKRTKRPSLIAAKFPSVSSEPKSTTSSVPMHLTPVIKIQNVEKPQRNEPEEIKSIGSVSSSSSEDPLIYRISGDKWQGSRYPLNRSMTDEAPRSACQTCIHTPTPAHIFRQVSLEDACHMGLLIPASKLSQSSSLCQSSSNMETPL